jgi:Ca2+-transporting ATPase
MSRSMLLLLFVLYENFHTLNSRSETRSVLKQPLFDNPLLIGSIIGAQVLHIVATYVPGLNETLGLFPFSPGDWALLLVASSTVLVAMELDKFLASGRVFGSGRRFRSTSD